MKEGWKVSTLGETCEMYQPKTISAKDMVPNGKYPVYGANGQIGYYDQFNHEEPQLLVTCRGATCGAINISKPKSWVTGNAMVVRPITDQIDLRFLEYAFHGAIDVASAITGAAQPQITRTNLNSITFSYPTDVLVQKGIVAILDKAFEWIATAVANAEKNLANAREMFTCYRDSVFSGKGEGWVTGPLAECLQLITYGFTNPMPSTDSGPYMITAKNVVGGKIDYANARYTSPEAFKNSLSEKSRPNIGDLLLTKDGTLGRVAVVDTAGICVNQSVAVLRPNNRMDATFMRHLLEASDYQKRMISDAGGTTIKHIYITRVDKMPVSYPDDSDEQQRIVGSLELFASEIGRLKSVYQQKLNNLDHLKRSILQKAFAGELTARSVEAVQEAAE